MIHYKNASEIEIMRQGGKILAEVLFETLDKIKPGMSEIEVDKIAENLIIKKGGYPGFKKVRGYHHATCISTNDVVVHGIPSDYILKEGDIIGVDCGVLYKGFNTDMAETIRVSSQKSSIRQTQDKPQKNDEVDKFLQIGKKALEEAILVAVEGNRIGHVSKTIQGIIEGGGYSVVRSLIGHGVGKKLHEEPEVPGYLERRIEKTPKILPGMTFAIEVIYNMGKPDVSYGNGDGWTISASDHSLAGLFERTIAITDKGTEILTK